MFCSGKKEDGLFLGLMVKSMLMLRLKDLSAAVDVYSDWIDACDAVKKGGEAENVRPGRGSPAPLRSGGGVAAIAEEEDDDLDGFVENDEPEGYDD